MPKSYGKYGKSHPAVIKSYLFNINLHPSLAAPFLFSPGVSIFVHFYQVVVTAVTAVTHGTAVTVGTVSGAHNPIIARYFSKKGQKVPLYRPLCKNGNVSIL